MLLSDDKQIVLSHVDLRYDDHLVLSDVSIEIFRGDFALIVGPNGGGKNLFVTGHFRIAAAR